MNTWFRTLLGFPAELADQPWQVVLRVQPPLWVLLGMLAACVALASWGYARLRGDRRSRILLAAVRTAILALIVTLCLQPVIEWPRERQEQDTVLVLADRSRSLQVSDESAIDGHRISRDEKLRSILSDPVWSRVKRSHQVLWFGCTGGVTAITDPATLPPATGNRTLLAASVLDATRSMEGRLVGSVVLVSDGRSQDTFDAATLAALRRAGVSIFTVPLGDPAGAADRSITEVEHPQRVFPRDRVPVQVTVASSGDAPVRVVLRDRGTGRVLDRVEARRGPDGRLHASLTGDRDGPGNASWEVALDPESADADPSNDRRRVDITSVDRPLRVLYLDGRPRWEFRYLRSILLREAGMESSIMLLSADRDFAQEGTAPLARLPATAEELAPFDVLVIGDVPSGAIDTVRQRIIREQVARRGTGLVWIGGERSTPSSWEGSPLEELLPFRGSLDLPRWDEPVLMRPTPESTRLGLLVLGDAATPWPAELDTQPEDWARLEWAQRIDPDRLKPTVEPWAVANRQSGNASSQETTSPLVVSMRYGAGTVVYVGTDETWRWRYGRGETLQERFWVPIIRHLARLGLRADPGTPSLGVEPGSCATGQPVRLTLDGAGKILVDEVVVEARRQGGMESVEMRLRSEGDGRFSATWAPDREGSWSLQLTQPHIEGVDPVSLQVRSEDAETRDTTPDHALLTALAQGSGGSVVPPASIGELDRKLPARSVTIRQPIQLPLWDRWFLYTLLAGLLAAEWLGRRVLRLA